MSEPEWDPTDEVQMARANLHACAYNAAVNYGSNRGVRKMGDLIRAINYYERAVGRAKLDLLVSKGVIVGYTRCPDECEIRPGGLFHAKDCENDCNHQVSKQRMQAATEQLPGGRDGHAGWRAVDVSLVG